MKTWHTILPLRTQCS